MSDSGKKGYAVHGIAKVAPEGSSVYLSVSDSLGSATIGTLDSGTDVSIWKRESDDEWAIVVPASGEVGWVKVSELCDIEEFSSKSEVHALHGKNLFQRAWIYTGHIGPELRFYLALGMATSGIVRLITGSNATPINYLPSQMYGILLIALGAWVISTCRIGLRCSLNGRIAAIMATSLYLLILLDIWGAPVSFSGVTLIVLALGNEVRIHEC